MPLDKQNFNYSIPLSASTLSSDNGVIVGDTTSSALVLNGKILYSANGTTYIPVGVSSLVGGAVAYQPTQPTNPVVGQIWVDSSSNNTNYDPNLIRRKTIVATGGQTVFTADLAFTDGYEQVFLNGLLLTKNTDYTTTSSTSIVLIVPAVVNDVVDILSITNLNSVGAAGALTTSNTFTGAQTFTPSSAAITPITINGAFNQTADLLDIKNYSGNALVSVLPSGNVGIGTSTPTQSLHVSGSNIRIDGTTSEGGLYMFRAGGQAPDLRFGNSNGSISSPTASNNGMNAGQIHFQSYDGSTYLERAGIYGYVDGVVSVGTVPTALRFFTGSTNFNEIMRISSAGQVGINTVSPNKTLTVAGEYNFGPQRSWNLGQPTVSGITSTGANCYTIKVNMSANYYKGFTWDVHMNGGKDWGGHGLMTYFGKMNVVFGGTTSATVRMLEEYSASNIDGTGFFLYNSASYTNDGTYLYITINYRCTPSSTDGHRPVMHVITYDAATGTDTSNTGSSSQINSVYAV
jgi:hypothetical protein